MFASHEVDLALAFSVARARLATLTSGGWLGPRSEQAYVDGLATLIRVGPFGSLLGASKLVRVSLLEPRPRGDQVVLPLRWEATGAMGRLFPVLDADLVLTPGARDGHCTLAMTGAYRPPLGAAGAALDRVMLNHAAAATVRSLLGSIAESLLDPDAAAGRAPARPPAPALPPPAAPGRPLPPAAWRTEPEIPC